MIKTSDYIIRDAINELCEACYQYSASAGFWEWRKGYTEIGTDGLPRTLLCGDTWNFGEKIALIHSELSEALEKHRKYLGKGLPDEPDEHCPQHGGVAIELADTMIRIFDLAGKMKIDLGRAILDKMAYNKTRPKKHGKAY